MRGIFRYARLAALLLSLLYILPSCVEEQGSEQGTYGSVQFRVVNSLALDTKAEVSSLDRLSDAHKIKVVMMRNGYTITQTIPLSCKDEDSGDYGVQSDRLSLLCGDYTIEGFYLYDALDNLLISVIDVDDKDFSVVENGLTLKELGVSATGWGRVSFNLVKDFVQTRAASGASYPFSKIRLVDICVRNSFSGKEYTLNKVKVSIKDRYDEDGRMTTYAVCDTIAKLPRGNYNIWSYSTYSDAAGRSRIETRTLGTGAASFTVEPFELAKDVEIPVKLAENAEYIKDYIALKEIWEAMDGPSWSVKWNFNRDIDLWGDQAGVTLGSDGRVITLNLSDFGIKGVVPDAIGQLTACQVLYLGNHNEAIGGYPDTTPISQMSAEQKRAFRMDYHHRVLERDVREDMSEPLVKGINADSLQRPVLKNNDRINLKDINFGILTNGVTGISRALARLGNLQQLYIANSPIRTEDFFVDVKPDSPFYGERLSWADMEALTDIEIYNCRNLTGLPLEMLTQLPDI
ncbi:MAG: DUF4458 domain-containing protein, partial [Bacteroidales bacterium]|nr:DUF4458 domain-containing protein [Bacteroidales bacterium]